MKHTYSFIFTLCMLAVLVPAAVFAADPTASTVLPPSNTTNTSGVCTGDILNNATAAQDCAAKAQAQAAARGYTASCNVTVSTSPDGSVGYYPGCTVAGSSDSRSAYSLVGWSGNGLSVNPSWDTLKTDMAYENAFSSCGGLNFYYSNGAYVCGTPPNGSGSGSSAAASGSGSSATSQQTAQQQAVNVQTTILNNAKNMISIFMKQLDALKTVGGTNTSTPTPSNGGVSTNGSCSQLTADLKEGSSGAAVTVLTRMLVAEGLMSAEQSTFDAQVTEAVKAYQSKYKNDILTPAGLTAPTGYVGVNTRTYMNSRMTGCGTTPTTPTTPVPGVSANQFRYLRVRTTKNGWISWREIEVYDTTGAKISISPAAVKASATYDGTWQYPPVAAQVAGNVVDGNSATVWNAGETNPDCTGSYGASCVDSSRSASITVDLGAVRNVSRIRLQQNGNALVETNSVEVSNDNQNFVSVASFSAPIGDSEWLEYPVSTTPRPDPKVLVKIVKQDWDAYTNPQTNQTEQQKLLHQAADLVTTDPGSTSTTMTFSVGEFVQNNYMKYAPFYLWNIPKGSADYVKIEKTVAVDSSLGTSACGVSQQFEDAYALDGSAKNIDPVIIFPDRLIGMIGGYVRICNVGHVYTLKLTAYQKNTGKTATGTITIKVKN